MIGILLYIAFMLLLLFGGVWVGTALGLAGSMAIWSQVDLAKVIRIFGTQIWNINTNFALVSLPLYIFMGELMSRSGMITKIYSKVSILLSGLPGNLLHANILSCGVFAACAGSSIASAAAIGSIGYPVQKELKYDRRLSLGSIAAGGTLGILIPPSIPMIIYAVLAEVSLGKLYLAGVIPGAILSFGFVVYILVACMKNPSKIPHEVRGVDRRQRLSTLVGLWEVIILVTVILGGIYAGIATPTEVAAVGAVLALFFGAVFNHLTLRDLRDALVATVSATSMIMFIVVGAQLLSTSLIFFNVAPQLSRFVISMQMSQGALICCVIVIYVVMGMFFDGISMMVITIPFVAPILKGTGIDLIWFGVFLTVLIEIGLLTPPVGLNLYVLRGITNEPIREIVLGSIPFIVPMVMLLIVLAMCPTLATWLPSMMTR